MGPIAFTQCHSHCHTCFAISDPSTTTKKISFNNVHILTTKYQPTQCVEMCLSSRRQSLDKSERIFWFWQMIAHAASVHLSADSDPPSHAVLPPNYALIGRPAADAMAIKLAKRLNWCRCVLFCRQRVLSTRAALPRAGVLTCSLSLL